MRSTISASGERAMVCHAAAPVELFQRLPASMIGAAFGVLDSLLIAAMAAGGLAGPLLATIAGTRWSLAVLAITATFWVPPWRRPLPVRLLVPSASKPSRLHAGILEGAVQ